MQEYQSLLDEHSRKLDACRSHIHDPAHLPRPTHDRLAPDQPQSNQQLVAELVHITDKAHTQLSITTSTLQKYGRALQLLKRAQDIRSDAEAALATIHNLHRLISQQTARVPPNDGIYALVSPATDDEQRLVDLLSSLEAELDTSRQTVEAGYASVKEIRSTGIDPNFSREMQSILDALAAEQKPSLAVLSRASTLLGGLEDARMVGKQSKELLEEVEGRSEVSAGRLRQRLWKSTVADEGTKDGEEQTLSTVFDSVREGLERVQDAHDNRRGLQEAAQRRLSACRSAQEDHTLLGKLCIDASMQASSVNAETQKMSALSEALEAAAASIEDPDDGRFAELERAVSSQLDALHQAIPFLSNPEATRFAATHADIDLEAHDTSVRQAINTASASLSARLSDSKRHQFRLQQVRGISSLKNELDSSGSALAEVESHIAQVGDKIQEHKESEVCKSLLAQLPSPSAFESHRSSFARMQETFAVCTANVKGFEDLELACSSGHQECEDLLRRTERAAASSSELSERIMKMLSDGEARQAALARRKAEEEASERQARERYESWSGSLDEEHRWLGELQDSVNLHHVEDEDQVSLPIFLAWERARLTVGCRTRLH